jgi:hypothetical protein
MTVQITLTDEERRYLVDLLDTLRSDKHAEVRRTEFSSSLHDDLRREEHLLGALLAKVQASEKCPA